MSAHGDIDHLKPCPFCGGEAFFVTLGNNRRNGYAIACMNATRSCPTVIPITKWSATPELAASEWNKRAE